MATTTKLMARTSAATSSTTIYTATGTAVVTNIAICNTSSASTTFTINVNGVALQSGTSLAANTTAYIDLKQVMANNQNITALAGTTLVNFHVSGVEIS